MITICLLAGDKELHQLTASTINKTGKAEVVSSFNNKNEFISHLKDISCDLTLIDINLPACNICALIKEIKHKRPDMPIIIGSAWVQPDLIYEALCSGASSWLNLNSIASEYSMALDQTLKGQAMLTLPLAEMITKRKHQYGKNNFTENQNQIIHLTSKGHSIEEICTLLKETIEMILLNTGRIYRELHLIG